MGMVSLGMASGSNNWQDWPDLPLFPEILYNKRSFKCLIHIPDTQKIKRIKP